MATIDETLRRVPPQSLEAEESVLGGIMLDNAAIDRVIELVRPDDFYRGAHRKLFRAMLDLVERSEPVDFITLSEALRARGELSEIGGHSRQCARSDAGTVPKIGRDRNRAYQHEGGKHQRLRLTKAQLPFIPDRARDRGNGSVMTESEVDRLDKDEVACGQKRSPLILSMSAEWKSWPARPEADLTFATWVDVPNDVADGWCSDKSAFD